MGQYWKVINLDRREVYDRYGSKLGESLFSRTYQQLPILLTKPTGHELINRAYLEQVIIARALHRARRAAGRKRSCWPLSLLKGTQTKHCPAPGPLERLPLEILAMIVDYLPTYEDIAHLSMTNTTFWLLGYRRIQLCYAEDLCPWAGDRLICFGDSALAEDLPKGAFTDDELEFMKASIKKVQQENQSDDEESESDSESDVEQSYTNLSDVLPLDEWQQVKIRSKDTHRWKDVFFWRMLLERDDRKNPDNEYITTLMRDLFDHLNCANPVYDRTKDWILCNLTKREYVRAEVIAKLTGTENAQGPFIGSEMTLGEVIVAHICWSSDDSISMANPDGDIHRGRWAGNRFEITTTDKVKNLDEEWKNVSDEVAKKMQTIWEANYGAEWRQQVLARPRNRW